MFSELFRVKKSLHNYIVDSLPDLFVPLCYDTAVKIGLTSIISYRLFIDVDMTYVPTRNGILLNSISTAIQFETPPAYFI